jgi:hypothetical protein
LSAGFTSPFEAVADGTGLVDKVVGAAFAKRTGLASKGVRR